MASAVRESNGLIGFLASALAGLRKPRLVVPVLALTILLTVSNIVIVMNLPSPGGDLGPVFAITAIVRVVGLLVLAVALLRIVNDSPRSPYVPDAGFWFYTLTFLISLAATFLVRSALGLGEALAGMVATSAIATALLAPLGAWFVALVVKRPVPWSPARWLRAFPSWLPHFLFWSLLLVTPLAALHAAIDLRLLEGAGNAFWPLALIDGPLSVAMALIALALGSEAYRRVARS